MCINIFRRKWGRNTIFNNYSYFPTRVYDLVGHRFWSDLQYQIWVLSYEEGLRVSWKVTIRTVGKMYSSSVDNVAYRVSSLGIPGQLSPRSSQNAHSSTMEAPQSTRRELSVPAPSLHGLQPKYEMSLPMGEEALPSHCSIRPTSIAFVIWRYSGASLASKSGR